MAPNSGKPVRHHHMSRATPKSVKCCFVLLCMLTRRRLYRDVRCYANHGPSSASRCNHDLAKPSRHVLPNFSNRKSTRITLGCHRFESVLSILMLCHAKYVSELQCQYDRYIETEKPLTSAAFALYRTMTALGNGELSGPYQTH